MRAGCSVVVVVLLLLLSSNAAADASQGGSSSSSLRVVAAAVAADNTTTTASVRTNREAHSSNELVVHRAAAAAVHHRRRRLAAELIWEERPTLFFTPVRRFKPQMSADLSRIMFTADSDPVTVRVAQFDSASQTWIPLGQEFIAAGLDRRRGAMAISGDGSTVATRFDLGEDSDSDLVRLYRYNLSTLAWNQIGQDITSVLTLERIVLSFNGETVAIHAPFDPGQSPFFDEPPGLIRVFSLSGEATWVQLGTDIDGGTAFGRFGWIRLSWDGRALGVSGRDRVLDRLVFQVYEYSASNGAWVQRGQGLARSVRALSADLSTAVTFATVFQLHFDHQCSIQSMHSA